MCKVCRWLVVSSVPWKLPYFKKAMWPAFQNLWGHGMNWWSWLVSFQQKRRSFLQLLQLPSSVEAKRRRASSIGTTLTSILCQMMMSTSLVPFFFSFWDVGIEDFGCYTSYTHIYVYYIARFIRPIGLGWPWVPLIVDAKVNSVNSRSFKATERGTWRSWCFFLFSVLLLLLL